LLIVRLALFHTEPWLFRMNRQRNVSCPPEPSASEPVKTKKMKSKKKTQLQAPGDETSAKPKNKTPLSMSIVTPSLMNGPDAVVASTDQG
jgi:hypothetical protein